MQTRGLSTFCTILLVMGLALGGAHGSSTFCAYSKQSVVKVSSSTVDKTVDDDGERVSFVSGELMDGNQTEKCPASSKFCYALWQEDFTNKNLTVILAQGCWDIAAEFDCSTGDCVSYKRPPKSSNNTKFCCCIGNMCNENVSDGYQSNENSEPVPRYVEHAKYDTQTVIIAVVTMCSLVVGIMVATCVTYHMCSSNQKPSPDSTYLMEAPPPSSPTFNIENLKIRESIGRGRYGHVYRGTLFNQTVAVKIFAAQNKQNYVSERYIYCLPFMDHPCLPKLIGAEERTGFEERPEYLLVLSYAPRGCLQDFLTENTIEWAVFCKMAQTVTQGLAHLHTEVRKDGKAKMCVAHRDLTSRNILVKADRTCMLCDFGFAICISGSKYYISGEEQVAEATSLTDVGTMRYMAPEVLEGAVNLRDCESSLKQIDIYALGLVLWELATRCVDLFQGVEVPDYKLPFAAEIGPHPSMEQMQVLVARHKARPLFPDIWKDTNPAVRSLKETIEDCWDQDAEARLTALCVEERLTELPILWDRHKAGSTIQGVSPTVNPTSTQQCVSNAAPAIQTTNTWNRGMNFEFPVLRSSGDMSSPNNIMGRSFGESSISENTAETSITMSPSELTPNSCTSYSSGNNNIKNLAANNVSSNLRVTVPLQPYQGKNPIMERNLILDPVEELAVSGNSLVDKKDIVNSWPSNSNHYNSEGDSFNLLQPNEASESNALVPNDELGHSVRTCNPIPYVQNAVHITSTIPKQPNVPGNGHSLHASGQEPPGNKKKRKGDEHKLVMGLKSFFGFSKGSSSSSVQASNPVTTPLISSNPCLLPTVNVPKFQNVCNGHKSCSETKPKQCLDTEVYISDDDFGMTQTIVRPVANKQVYSQTVSCDHEEDAQGSPTTCVVQSQTHPLLSSEFNNRCLEISANGQEQTPNVKRPNTLPVAKFGARRQLNYMPCTYAEAQVCKKRLDVKENANGAIPNGVTSGHADATRCLKNRQQSLCDVHVASDREHSTQCAVSSSEAGTSSAMVPHTIDTTQCADTECIRDKPQ